MTSESSGLGTPADKEALVQEGQNRAASGGEGVGNVFDAGADIVEVVALTTQAGAQSADVTEAAEAAADPLEAVGTFLGEAADNVGSFLSAAGEVVGGIFEGLS